MQTRDDKNGDPAYIIQWSSSFDTFMKKNTLMRSRNSVLCNWFDQRRVTCNGAQHESCTKLRNKDSTTGLSPTNAAARTYTAGEGYRAAWPRVVWPVGQGQCKAVLPGGLQGDHSPTVNRSIYLVCDRLFLGVVIMALCYIAPNVD